MSWAERLRDGLRKLGVDFESEAEAIRISLPKGTQIETVENEAGGISLSFSIPLPSEGPEDPEYYIEALREALVVLLNIDKKYKYEVDESLSDYPLLRIYVDFKDGNELTDKLLKSLEKLIIDKS